MNFSKQRKNILYVLAVNYGIYLLMCLFFYPTYECQLDEMMQAAICGVSGRRTGYILYSNLLTGWILAGLASVLPVINWYFAYLCALVIGALLLIGYVVIGRTDLKTGLTVSVVLSAFVGYECYVLPGHMKTSCVLGAAMLVILADYLERKGRRDRRRECLIVLLAVLSSMVSFSVFLLTAVTGMVGMALYYGIQNASALRLYLKREKRIDKDMVKRLSVLAVCVVAAVTLFRVTDCMGYRVSGQGDAVKYRAAMIRMYGYGMADYKASFETDYGIDSVEYDAIKKGSFGVAGETSWQKLDGVSQERMALSGDVLDSFFKQVPIELFSYGIFYLFIILLFLLLYSPAKGKKRIVCMELGLLLVCFFLAYLSYAWQNNWMVFVLIFPLLVPLLLALKGTKEKDCRYLWVYLTVFSVILYSKFSSGIVTSVSQEKMGDRFSNLNTGQVNLIDLNAYFKSFSAQRIYTANILTVEGVKVSNGAYALMDGFENVVLSAYPAENAEYGWIYNPKELSVWNLVFED